MHLNLSKNTGILFLLILMFSCSVKEKSSVSVYLKPELSIGVEEGDENYMFGGVADVEEDEQGNIYVLDYKFWTIKKYDKNGRFIKNIGRKGIGPGEIPQFPVDMALMNGKIYLLLINMVNIYDMDGNFSNAFKTAIISRHILVNSKDKIILVGETFEKPYKLFHFFDSNGLYLASFVEAFQAPNLKLKKISEKWLPDSVFLSKDGKLFVAHPFRYEIFIYKNTILEKSFKVRSNNYKTPKVIVEENGSGSYSYSKEGRLERIFEVKDYLLVILNGENGKFIDVFEKKDFIYKGSSKIEIKGQPFPTSNGRIYFGDEWKITKYKIFIEKVRRKR